MKLHFSPTDLDPLVTPDILIDGTEGQLVLLINDVVTTHEAISTLMHRCDIPEQDRWMCDVIENHVFKGRIAEALKKKNKSAEYIANVTSEIWYWDNNGIFTVIIKKTNED